MDPATAAAILLAAPVVAGGVAWLAYLLGLHLSEVEETVIHAGDTNLDAMVEHYGEVTTQEIIDRIDRELSVEAARREGVVEPLRLR